MKRGLGSQNGSNFAMTDFVEGGTYDTTKIKDTNQANNENPLDIGSIFEGIQEYINTSVMSTVEPPHDMFSNQMGYGQRTGVGAASNENVLPQGYVNQTHQLKEDYYKFELGDITWISYSSTNTSDQEENMYKIEFGRDENDQRIHKYVNQTHVTEINDIKSSYDHVDYKAFNSSRTRTNPVENISKSIFQNRAALKAAEIDLIAKVASDELKILPEEDSVLYFADICAGPGGFTEFIYWKNKDYGAKGFGFTIRDEICDWKLNLFNNDSPCSNFHISYGADKTGDILKTENLHFFQKEVLDGTNQRGVALVMADGGFRLERGQENLQEHLSRHLILCECLCALMILRKGGNFFCKLFDTYNEFTLGLLYILYTSFQEFGIMKPITSRPANSERFVVCRNLKVDRAEVHIRKLLEISEMLNQGQHVTTIIDPITMANDHQFVNYITNINNTFAESQIRFLRLIKMGIEDPHLSIPNQAERSKQYLQEWRLPTHNQRRGNYHQNNNRRFNNQRRDGRYRQNHNQRNQRHHQKHHHHHQQQHYQQHRPQHRPQQGNNQYSRRPRPNDYLPDHRPQQYRRY